ncbi:DJ-1/PfpI family protein [Pedobacter sp. N36a]|uniref:DJ-1/PfpI family protein n=1 Tax=Pedobacter sp. N36a TaxID=2767996 RepID=UPI0016573055|nr:DJ-1/PfpI family protein [Pedobacter sp. N36a]MBC8986329.1 DJ-1/PfpI family protein [Pedobacter sp. N36a]
MAAKNVIITLEIFDNMNQIIVLLLGFLGLYSTSNPIQKRILFVTSNRDFYGNKKIAASNHFEEITVPYDIFKKAGYTVDFISPKGGAISIDHINTSNSLQKRYLYDGCFMDKLEHTMKPSEITAENYQAIFYTGGPPMSGVTEDTAIQEISRKIYNKNGVVSAICHGTAGMAFLKDESVSFLDKKQHLLAIQVNLRIELWNIQKLFSILNWSKTDIFLKHP